MDNFLPHKIFSCILLHSLFLFSSAYDLPQQYFINCGSASRITVDQVTFTGDEKSDGIALSSGGSSTVEDSRSSTPELYRSARIFRRTATYELDIVQNGTYVVSFHFFPFSAPSDARFSVEASKFRLLSNFSVQNSSDSTFPIIKEFLLTIPVGKFKIRFVPSEKNSFAFVNAMEVFLAPPDFIPDSADGVTPEGQGDRYNGLLSPLRVIHRINVGGSNIVPNNDTLWRYWIPDDKYLINNDAAENQTYGGGLSWGAPITEFVAPATVYNTAKKLKNISQLNTSNILWRFDVKKGAKHFVRVHFCDIVSLTSNENLTFNLFIYGKFEIYPYHSASPRTGAAPFYIDYVADSDDSGFLNVSVGPRRESRNPTAFLNGLEILELITESASSQEGSDSAKRRLLIIIASSVGGLILVLIFLALFYLRLRKRKLKLAESFHYPVIPLYGGSSDSKTTNKTVSGSSHDLNLGLKVPFSEILYATKNFDNKLIIGEGGFGKVYKGVLRNGTKVAVKRSQPGHGQGFPEFQTEIIVLSRIRHHHLVSLIGYCDERDEMILVYEFMEKGTLREHLYALEGESGESKSKCELSWDQRLRICIGAAKGIDYLHTGASGAIIHRDIKSTNILLDSQFVAKVADFGLSRSGPPDETHFSTDVKGSFGYLDPEYFRCLQLTQKSDVYSFGVVLLEILCARPAIVQSQQREQVNLAEWGLSWQHKGQLEKIVDPFLDGKINPNSLRKFGETVEKCLQDNGADRPNMVDVLWDLEYSLKLQHTAMPRAPYEDSTTEVSLGIQMNILQRLPSNSIPIGEDELQHDQSYSFSDASQGNASEAFSLLKIHEAR